VLPLATFNFLSLSTLSFKETFTMTTKTKNRKTVRKADSIESIRKNNWRIYDSMEFPKPLYNLYIEVQLTSFDDIHAPEEFIASMEDYHGIKRREIQSMLVGAGTALTTGVRDLHFKGYIDEMDAIMETFTNTGEWKIVNMSVTLDAEEWMDEESLALADTREYRRTCDRIAKRRNS